MTTLTVREKEVLLAIRKFIGDNTFAPSLRDIMCATGIASTSHVRFILNKLEEKGMIRKVKNQARSIVVTLEGLNG